MNEFNKNAQETGTAINTLAIPSQVEIIRKQIEQKQKLLKSAKMQNITNKYGNQDDHYSMPVEIQEQLQEQLDQDQMELLDKQMELKRYGIG